MTSRSSTITESSATLSPSPQAMGADEAMLAPIPPGEVLLEEFMRPLGVSQNRLARDIDAPVSRIAGIVKGERAITADTALRLAQFLEPRRRCGWPCRATMICASRGWRPAV